MDVVVDEDVARHWQQNHFKQMGVVVGLGEQTIVASFPTPSTESECDDPEWVAEHSMQVSRMLVGGLHVRGVYLLETNEKWSENFDFMNKCTSAIATALEDTGHLYHVQYGLLQLFATPTNKYLCKRVNSRNSNEQEAAVKIQPATLEQLYTLTSTFALSLSIPLPKDSQNLVQNSLQPFVESSVNQLASHLKKTIALVDGRPYSLSPLSPSPSSPVIPLSTLGPSLQQTVTLLAPSIGNICSEEYKKGKGEIGRCVEVRGNIVGFAVGSAESSLEDTLDYLAGDLCATLRTRLNLMCETETPSPELPSRIVARIPISRSKPVARNSILLCDYVTSDESVRETHERFQALLALDLPKPASVDGTDIGLVFREDSAPLVPQQNSQKTQQPNSEKNPNHNLQEKQVQLNIQQKGFLLPMVVAVVVAFVSVVLFLMQK